MTKELLQQALEALYENTQYSMRGDPMAYQDERNDDTIEVIKAALAQQEHPEQMARLGWQYVECPACGSEGARAFPKPEQEPECTCDAEVNHWCRPEHAAPLAQPDNTSKLYEELRSIIDGGSESFTHKDAVQYLKDNLAPLKWTPEDTAYRPGGLAQPEQDQTEIAFEAWWQAHGQFCRAGGGDYEKTFAYSAWLASLAIQEKPEQEPCDMGVACIGCSPRNTDGSCPHEKPNGACECYIIGFNDGMKELEPPQRPWVDLEPEDRLCAKYMLDAPEGIEAVIDYITAKLKEKNT